MRKKPTMLMILDGYGIRENPYGNAVKKAYTPNLDRLFQTYPNTTLSACGKDVGLPDGQMGNSEVGHLNIGAGRIVYQDFTRISKAISDGDFFENPVLTGAMDFVKQNNSSLHLMGLLSDGGVHSHITHVFALLELARRKNIQNVYLHCFLDGRDVPPTSAPHFIEQLEKNLREHNLGKIATISGRYYAMDRDNRMERVQLAYDALTLGKGEHAETALQAVKKAYDNGVTDEFVLPTVITNETQPPCTIRDRDGIIMFNFRPDRAREITRCFVDPAFSGIKREVEFSNLYYACMTQYDATMPSVQVAFEPQTLKNTLGEYLSKQGLKQLRIAETEKYAHVTFFFNGGVEVPNEGEDRILTPSPKVATYDLQPEMSAFEVTDTVLKMVEQDSYDVIILNFANPDMVGHTGNFNAAVKAIEALDLCVEKILEAIKLKDGQLLLTADHGNSDDMLTEDGEPITSHSLSRVPFLISSDVPLPLRQDGILADIAPTMLYLMNLPQPSEMEGRNLII